MQPWVRGVVSRDVLLAGEEEVETVGPRETTGLQGVGGLGSWHEGELVDKVTEEKELVKGMRHVGGVGVGC